MNKKFIVMAAFAAVFGMSFTACSNEDESVATGNNIPATRAISFNSYMDGVGATRAYNASVADIQTDGISVWAFDATKETAINNEGGTYFMGGYNAGLAHTYGLTGYATVWKAAADYFWPEYNLNFVALTPQSGGGIGTITCSQAAATGEPAVPSKPVMTVAVNVPLTTEDGDTYSDTQKDIMFASLEDQGALDEFAPAPLSFKHGLSQLVFKGVIDHETTITKAVVKSIKLVNVAASGTLTYTAADDAIVASGWGDKDQTYAANIVNDEVTTLDNSGSADAISGQDDNASGRDYQMMIMPQASVLCVGATTENLSQLSAPTAGTYLLVNATLYANNNDTDAVLENTTNVYIPLAVTTWAPNTKYTYTLKFGDNLLHPITFTASISDWATDSKNVEF